MGIFGAILDKLRGHKSENRAQQQPAAGAQQPSPAPGQGQPAGQPTAQGGLQGSSPQGQPPLQNVDVEAVLAQLAAQKGGGGNYRESIVDLLKLLDLDSSLAARKALAEELGVNAGPHGSAEQNIALHRAVMRKLAENGGKVPESLKH